MGAVWGWGLTTPPSCRPRPLIFAHLSWSRVKSRPSEDQRKAHLSRGEGLRRGGSWPTWPSENGTFVQNCHSPTPMTLEGSTAVRQAWYHLGRHGGDLGAHLRRWRVRVGGPEARPTAHLSEGEGEGRSVRTLPETAFRPHLRGRDPPPPEADFDPSCREPPLLPLHPPVAQK